ncbi:MAG: hypothetical protein Fur0014_18890 [Rubrivivax sp.]
MKLRSPLVLSLLAAVLALPAHAVSTASASLGPLTVTLYDLNPLDGIDPSLTFDSTYPEYGNYLYSGAYNSQPSESQSLTNYGSAFATISQTAAVSTASHTAAITGMGTIDSTTVSASGFALGTADTNPFGYQYSSFAGYAYTPYYTSFTLSNNTAVVISAASVLAADVTSTFDPATSYQHEWGTANTQLYISGPAASGGGSQYAYDSASISVGSTFFYDSGCTWGYCYGAGSTSDTRTLAVSFVNLSGGDLSGTFYAQAYVNGYSYAQAVPEPETYAMMLGGLLGLGFIARRRGRA